MSENFVVRFQHAIPKGPQNYFSFKVLQIETITKKIKCDTFFLCVETGNVNGNKSDDFLLRNGTLLMDLPERNLTDRDIFQFGQSCKYSKEFYCHTMS